MLLLSILDREKNFITCEKCYEQSFPSRFKVGLEASYCLWAIYEKLN